MNPILHPSWSRVSMTVLLNALPRVCHDKIASAPSSRAELKFQFIVAKTFGPTLLLVLPKKIVSMAWATA